MAITQYCVPMHGIPEVVDSYRVSSFTTLFFFFFLVKIQLPYFFFYLDNEFIEKKKNHTQVLSNPENADLNI